MKSKNSISIFMLALLLVFQGAYHAHAALTKQLSYQGRLNDASGQPVANGTYSVTFSIYNVLSGGAPLYTETQNVTVDKGGFSAYIGSVTPLNLLFNEDYFLGIKVGSDPEMTPRLKLAIVGTSVFALDAGNLGGQLPSAFAPSTHNHDTFYSSLTHTHTPTGVTQIVAGTGVTLSPTGGTGIVTINASGGGGANTIINNPAASQTIVAGNATTVPLALKAAATPSVPVFDIQDSTGLSLLHVNPAGKLQINNNTFQARLSAVETGTGNDATHFEINNAASSFVAVAGVTNGSGGAVVGQNTGTGEAGNFQINNASNSVSALHATTNGTGVAVFGENTGTGTAGNFFVNNVSNASAIIAGNTTGTGNLLSLNQNGTPKFVVDNTGNIVVGGAANGIKANPTVAQTIQGSAASFTPLIIKGQPSMTAPIFQVQDDAGTLKLGVMPDGHVFIPSTNQLHVLNINNDSPTGPMGNMTIDVMNNAANSVLNITNSNVTYTASLAVEGNLLVGNPTTTTAKVSAYETGTVNSGGFFEINNAANTSTAVTGVITSGGGPAGAFQINDGSNTDSAVAVATAGTGYAGYFEVSNATNASAGVYSVITQGSGPAFLGEVSAFSTGSAGVFQILNASNAAPLLAGDNSGTGNLLQLKQSGVDKFVVDNTGKIGIGTATPGATIDFGTNATPGIKTTAVGANIVLNANDAASSTVTITNSGAGTADLNVEGNVTIGNGISAATPINVNTMTGAGTTIVLVQNPGAGVANLKLEAGGAFLVGTDKAVLSPGATVQRVQSGRTCEGVATDGFINITYPAAFGAAPVVVGTLDKSANPATSASVFIANPGTDVTATTAKFSINAGGDAAYIECVQWIAIGN